MLVHVECCVLTTWKFIDFHVNPSLATNGNEQFVWVVIPHINACLQVLFIPELITGELQRNFSLQFIPAWLHLFPSASLYPLPFLPIVFQSLSPSLPLFPFPFSSFSPRLYPTQPVFESVHFLTLKFIFSKSHSECHVITVLETSGIPVTGTPSIHSPCYEELF